MLKDMEDMEDMNTRGSLETQRAKPKWPRVKSCHVAKSRSPTLLALCAHLHRVKQLLQLLQQLAAAPPPELTW